MADDFAVSPEAAKGGRFGTSGAQDAGKSPVVQATLMPADPAKGYSTPYYAAYTNDGDMAGAVMVAPGQKVRLVDKMTGDVVFEGVGPEAAKTATTVANSISKDKGRTAAWAIQKPTDEGGWVSMAEERWDPKKQSLLGKVADFALPVLGAILLPGVGGVLGALGKAGAMAAGSALGSAASSAAQGRNIEDTLKRAALSAGLTYVGANVMGKLTGGATKAPFTAPDSPLTAIGAGEKLVGSTIPSNVPGLAPTGSMLGGTFSAAAGDVGANTISELVITAAKSGMPSSTIAATYGLPAATVNTILKDAPSSPSGEGNLVDEVVVEAEKPGTFDPGAGVVGTIGSDVVLNGTTIPKDVPDLDTSGPDYKDPTWQQKVLDWIKANPLDAASLGLSLVGGGVSAGSGSSGGSGGIPPGFEAAGTPGSLSDVFRAKLPAPSGPFADLSARNVAMTPEQWKTYGQRSEQSFFNNVPQRPSGVLDTSRRAPPMPMPEPEPGFAANVTQRFMRPDGNVEVVNGDERMVFDSAADADAHEAKQAAWRATIGQASQAPAASPLGVASSTPVSGGPTFANASNPYSSDDFVPRGSASSTPFREVVARPLPMPAPSAEPERFAKGGFAVRGMGSGRDDKIPARLSDGEYVMDAETVALLGDGSSDAGAKRLDAFRANIRKHKGKKLARGEFSVNAKKPEAYLKGGRA